MYSKVICIEKIYHSVGPQWWILYFRFFKSVIAGIIAYYFIQ